MLSFLSFILIFCSNLYLEQNILNEHFFRNAPNKVIEENVMVPIPHEDRVFNETGIQCVWAAIECLGNFAEEPKLFKLTDDVECKSYANPNSLAKKLKKLNVKFEQTLDKSDKSLIIKSVVREKRGCLFGITGHAMVLIHYDEANRFVKYINNSDKSLKVRFWSMDEFENRWDGWVCAVYPDKDKFEIQLIPIIDKTTSQGYYNDFYILKPNLF